MGLIQIRNVPDDVHRTLKARVARTPTPEELDERIRARGAAGVSTRDILAARDRGRRE